MKILSGCDNTYNEVELTNYILQNKKTVALTDTQIIFIIFTFSMCFDKFISADKIMLAVLTNIEQKIKEKRY